MDDAWLKLARAPGLSARRVLDMLPATGGAEGFCALPEAELRRLGLNQAQCSAIKAPDRQQLEADARWLEHPRRHLLKLTDADYPSLLKSTPSPPLILWVEGDPGALWQPQLAMVGSRNPTAGGLAHARDFAGTLARGGWTITSGFAAGIDVACHRAALEASGQTVAVFGTGLDIIYPRSNAAFAGAIADQGALVSELPPGTPPRKQNFPGRNRIIAGLSLGVLVVEAALNSGSLITARLAAEQGREVFALPGSLHNPMVKGCHRLIKQGARLAESTTDITEALAPLAQQLALGLSERLAEAEVEAEAEAQRGEPVADATAGSGSRKERGTGDIDNRDALLADPDYERLWALMGFDPLSQDELAARSGLSAREVSSMLLMLELRGLVASAPGGRFSRVEA